MAFCVTHWIQVPDATPAIVELVANKRIEELLAGENLT